MQPNVYHIKPTRLSKATTLLQSLPTPEEEKERLHSWDYTRSHALQNMMQEALNESITPIRIHYHVNRPSPGFMTFRYSEMMGNNAWSFLLELSPSGILNASFKRNDSYEHPYRQGRYSPQIHSDLTELRRAFGIMAFMIMDVVSKNREEVKYIELTPSELDTKKATIYKRFAEILARRFGGKASQNITGDVFYVFLDGR
jgi:hypothetical protein